MSIMDKDTARYIAALEKALEEIKRIGVWTGTDGLQYASAEARVARAALDKDKS